MSAVDSQAVREKEFEELEELLAALACGEIDRDGHRRLNELAALPRHQNRYDRYVQTLEYMAPFAPAELVDERLERRYQDGKQRPGILRFVSRKSTLAGLAAAAAFVLAQPLLFQYLQNDVSGPQLQVDLAAAQGDCLVDGQPVASGTGHALQHSLRSGTGAVCDFSVHGARSLHLRLLGSSELGIESHARAVHVHLEHGRLVVAGHAEPAANKEKEDVSGQPSQSLAIRVSNAGHLVELVGTQFAMDRTSPEAALRVDLVAGALQLRSAAYLHVPALRGGLHDLDGHRRELEQAAPDFFREERTRLAPGQSLELQHTAAHVKNSAALYVQLHELIAKHGQNGRDPAWPEAVRGSGAVHIGPALADRLIGQLRRNAHLRHSRATHRLLPQSAGRAAEIQAHIRESAAHREKLRARATP